MVEVRISRKRGRPARKGGKGSIAGLRGCLDEQQKVIDELRRRVAELETRTDLVDEACAELADVKENYTCSQPTTTDDLIGCLDDCVKDLEELRSRSRDVRRKKDHS